MGLANCIRIPRSAFLADWKGSAVIQPSYRFGYRASNYFTITGHDIGNAVAHGIGHARLLSPEGVKAGIEQVKYLLVVSGGGRTTISYGPM